MTMRLALVTAAAVAIMGQPPAGGPPGGMRGGPPGMGDSGMEPAKPGETLRQKDVKQYGSEPLYEPKVLRTFFLEFDGVDWEKRLDSLRETDGELQAKLTVDGKTYANVGVRFRGMTSYMMVPEGRKKSLNLSVDLVNKDQRLLGYRTLNLLNAHQDPSFLKTALYMHIARQYTAAPRVNFVRVVINGESWGVYVNAQQFNTDFTQDAFGTRAGARWKVPGSPMGQGGLRYLGEQKKQYERIYEIRSRSDQASWAALIRLTKVLTETPLDQLEAALSPMMDVDSVLKFLAVEKALINNDGYWIRASDYSLYMDDTGKFRLIPHDVNESLGPMAGFGPGGPGGPGPRGPGRGGRGFGPPGGMPMPPPGMEGGPPMPPVGMAREGNVEVDPFAGSDDPNKILLNRLLAVPALRARYLGYVRQVAAEWMDWKKVGPVAEQMHSLIAEDVRKDTKKTSTTEAFEKSLTVDTESRGFGPMGGSGMSLKTFFEKRRAYLLGYQEKQKPTL